MPTDFIYDDAKRAIRRVHTESEPETALEDLRGLRDEIDVLIDVVEGDIRRKGERDSDN